MFYFEKVKRLGSSFFALRKYKSMHPAAAVITFMLLLPFVITFLVFYGVLFMESVFLSIWLAPVEWLHGLMKKEGQEVKVPTQVVIYLFSWPLLFLCYAYLGLITIFFYMTYFFTVLVGYISSFSSEEYFLNF